MKLQEKKSAMVDATLSADESVSASRRRIVQALKFCRPWVDSRRKMYVFMIFEFAFVIHVNILHSSVSCLGFVQVLFSMIILCSIQFSCSLVSVNLFS